MKKQILIILMILMILPLVLAIDLTIEKQTSNEVMVVDVGAPAIVDLKVTNNEKDDSFLFYTFFGQGIEPAQRIQIKEGETKDIQLAFLPRQDNNLRGFTTFEYFIQSFNKTQLSKKITINLIDLKDAFEIGSQEINPESNTIIIYIQNKVNTNFDKLRVELNSPFFEIDQEFELMGNQKKTFEVNLNKEDFDKLLAGFYTMNAKITSANVSAEIESQIKFVEKDLLKTTESKYGFLINTEIVEKENKGNTVVDSSTTIEKSIISRMFTTFNPEPSSIERQGTKVYYTWNQKVNPGETLKIKAKTNWILPFIILILIIAILIIVKRYSEKDLILRKRISFVQAKGGEFALKVTIFVKARKYLEKVNIIDRLPPLVKIYERFLNERPSKVDEAKKRVEWGFEKLEEGERRVLSYIIYSKVGVLGKFALPSTTGIYELQGKIKETTSNKVYFVAEQIQKKSENFD